MKIERVGKTETIFSGSGLHDYFAWPSIERLKNGEIVVACSGFRRGHICPFGKVVMAISRDEGETFTPPQVCIDTYLDDRDAGLCAFGKSGLIVTSFNNSVAFQKKQIKRFFGNKAYREKRAYYLAYLKQVPPEREAEAYGSVFRVSTDDGVTFGPIYHSPITSPHGPIELSDGTILWVGRVFSENETIDKNKKCLQVYTLDPSTGAMSLQGEIEDIFIGRKMLSCEPYALQLKNGDLICHIRVENPSGERVFTLYQTESSDKGKTWTRPHPVLDRVGGAPAHLMKHSSGALISVYGYRNDPVSIRAIISMDDGKSWSEPLIVCDEMAPTWDMGYPASVEVEGGDIVTAFYAHPKKNGPANILKQKWRLIV